MFNRQKRMQKMRTIEVVIDTGFVGGKHTDTFEVEDDATPDEIEEMVQDVVQNYISVSWIVKD
jgi:hypothetical protein